jgi:hypothetical protein
MTYQQILCAVDDTAELAAQSAFDAFAGDAAAQLPSPEMARTFLNESICNESICGDEEIKRPAALPACLSAKLDIKYLT